jgi:hypothetical protein
MSVSMNLSYETFSPNLKEKRKCPVCLDSISGNTQKYVAHQDLGQSHPICLPCAKAVAAVTDKCPTCQFRVDASSLFTWKERNIIELTHIKEDALHGIFHGLIHAISIGVLIGGGAVDTGMKAIEAGKGSVAVDQAIGIGVIIGGGVGVLRIADLLGVKPKTLAAAAVGTLAGGVVAIESVATAVGAVAEEVITTGVGVSGLDMTVRVLTEISILEIAGVVGATAAAAAIVGFFQRR